MKRIMFALSVALAAGPALAADGWRDKALKMVTDEKQVVEAMFPQNRSLWVSVRDDGTPRNGFADYLCLVLHDAGMPKGDFVVIRILDAAALTRDERKELGKSECSAG